MENVYHEWKPITDLPSDVGPLENGPFHAVAPGWLEAGEKLEGDMFTAFSERLRREWIIELGRVEFLYRIGDDVAETLIGRGLRSVELAAQDNGMTDIAGADPALFFQTHEDVLDGLYRDAAGGEPVTRYMLLGLHNKLVEFQDYSPGIAPSGRIVRMPLRKGQFKVWPNDPTRRGDGLVHQYCPPARVDSEIGRLLGMHRGHEARKVPVDVEAAWFHHRFIQIHPFQDGNGRTARALASFLYVRAGFLPPVVTLKTRPAYLDALDLANKGDLKPFVDFLAGLVTARTEEGLVFLDREAKAAAGEADRPRPDGEGAGRDPRRGPRP
jgi:hypothetical protein